MVQPNVLVVMADDARADDFHHMRVLQERVAGAGTRLRRFYAPGPLCSPNRATFLTGQYPHNTGVTNNRIGVGGLDEARTLAVWLQAAGYTTSLVGKYINGIQVTDPIPPGWDNWMVPGRGVTYNFENSTINANGRIEQLELHTNLAYSLRAQSFIERHTSEPWFQWVSFVSPHVGQPHERVSAPPFAGDEVGRLPTRRPGSMGWGPFVRRPYRNAYDGPTLPVGTDIREHWTDEELAALRWLVQRRRDSLSDVDAQLDAMLTLLQETNQLARTFVIVVSDNGFQYGEHGIRPGKDQPYEESVRIPCYIRGPGIRKGYTHPNPAGMMDLVPTILRMVGASATRPPTHVFDGTSLLGRISVPGMGGGGHDRVVLLESGENESGVGWSWRGLVTRNRKYAEYVDGLRLLFDLDEDPHENNNLARDRPAEASRLHDLLTRLKRCAGDTCDLRSPI